MLIYLNQRIPQEPLLVHNSMELCNNKYINKYIQIRVVVTEWTTWSEKNRRGDTTMRINRVSIREFMDSALIYCTALLDSFRPGHRFPLFWSQFVSSNSMWPKYPADAKETIKRVSRFNSVWKLLWPEKRRRRDTLGRAINGPLTRMIVIC